MKRQSFNQRSIKMIEMILIIEEGVVRIVKERSK